MHSCKPLPFMYGQYRVTRVANRYRGRMYTQECRCGATLPITWPSGDARSNDRIPRREIRLARLINDACRLWAPGRGRSEAIEQAVEACR